MKIKKDCLNPFSPSHPLHFFFIMADVNECSLNNPSHDCDQICINTNGGFDCSCREQFYVLANDGRSCEGIANNYRHTNLFVWTRAQVILGRFQSNFGLGFQKELSHQTELTSGFKNIGQNNASMFRFCTSTTPKMRNLVHMKVPMYVDMIISKCESFNCSAFIWKSRFGFGKGHMMTVFF